MSASLSQGISSEPELGFPQTASDKMPLCKAGTSSGDLAPVFVLCDLFCLLWCCLGVLITPVSFLQCTNDSEEDMFGDYDSFCGSDSLVAQVDDIEHKYLQDNNMDVKAAAEMVLGNLQSGVHQKEQDNSSAPENVVVLKSDQEGACQMCDSDPAGGNQELTESILDDLPCSQLLYFEKMDELFSASRTSPVSKGRDERVNSSSDKIRDPLTFSADAEHRNRPPDSSSHSKCVSFKTESLKDHLKSAMTGNARAQTLQVSKTKQLKEAVLSEEIFVARKVIESSSVDIGPFYGLPSKVKDLFRQLRGIETLYGSVTNGLLGKKLIASGILSISPIIL